MEKNKRFLVDMRFAEVLPKRPIYRPSFVKYYWGGILVYDYREGVKEFKYYASFIRHFKGKGIIQLAHKNGHTFIKIFDEKEKYDENGGLLQDEFEEDGMNKVFSIYLGVDELRFVTSVIF